MAGYSDSFDLQDQARIFSFVATFARWESALKRGGFVRRGNHDQAEADWNAFADRIAARLERLASPDFDAGRAYLFKNPPQRLMFDGGWQPNPRRDGETDARYLFRVIRDVRNNLFHGGKYESADVAELARDRTVIDHSITVLNACHDLERSVRGVLEEAA